MDMNMGFNMLFGIITQDLSNLDDGDHRANSNMVCKPKKCYAVIDGVKVFYTRQQDMAAALGISNSRMSELLNSGNKAGHIEIGRVG